MNYQGIPVIVTEAATRPALELSREFWWLSPDRHRAFNQSLAELPWRKPAIYQANLAALGLKDQEVLYCHPALAKQMEVACREFDQGEGNGRIRDDVGMWI